MKRARYKCNKCKKEWYPLDNQFELSKSKASKRFAKLICHATIFMPFKDAKKLCEEFLLISPSVTMEEQIITRIGSKLHKNHEKKSRFPYAIKKKEKNVDILYIEADGAFVPIITKDGREFKENKLGIVFNNNDIITKARKNGKSYSEIVKKRMVSSIDEGVDPFKKMLYSAAIEKGFHNAKQVIFLGDGATWLSKCKEEYFPNAVQILDWYHAMEHLWDAAHAIFGESNMEKCREWVEPLEELLWHGKVATVIKRLEAMAFNEYKKKQTPLFELRGYYVSFKESMKYSEYRENGWYIGSCAIESANKYIVSQRLKLSGMQWTIPNADAMIWARCKYFENMWDEFWDEMNLADYLNEPVIVKKSA